MGPQWKEIQFSDLLFGKAVTMILFFYPLEMSSFVVLYFHNLNFLKHFVWQVKKFVILIVKSTSPGVWETTHSIAHWQQWILTWQLKVLSSLIFFFSRHCFLFGQLWSLHEKGLCSIVIGNRDVVVGTCLSPMRPGFSSGWFLLLVEFLVGFHLALRAFFHVLWFPPPPHPWKTNISIF